MSAFIPLRSKCYAFQYRPIDPEKSVVGNTIKAKCIVKILKNQRIKRMRNATCAKMEIIKRVRISLRRLKIEDIFRH